MQIVIGSGNNRKVSAIQTGKHVPAKIRNENRKGLCALLGVRDAYRKRG